MIISIKKIIFSAYDVNRVKFFYWTIIIPGIIRFPCYNDIIMLFKCSKKSGDHYKVMYGIDKAIRNDHKKIIFQMRYHACVDSTLSLMNILCVSNISLCLKQILKYYYD